MHTLIFAFWWNSVLRLEEIKWAIPIHYHLATQDPVGLFHITNTKWVLPYLIYSVTAYVSLLITFVTFLWTFSHFKVLFLLWDNQNCTGSSRVGPIMNSYEIKILPDLFSNLFLIMSKFWGFLTSIEQRHDIFQELSIMYHFKFIFFVLFHLPFYCLDMLSCKILLPSFIVCPHHLEGFWILSKLCRWTAHALLKLIYACIKQHRLLHNTPGDFWLLQELTIYI